MDAPSSDQLTITIDGRQAEVARGITVLEAARGMGIAIPTLCHYRGIEPYGACRICLVEMDTPGGPRQIASCSYPAEEGMVVRTDTEAVLDSRRTILELMLAQAPESEELAAFAAEHGVQSTPYEPTEGGDCILCGLCTRVCGEVMGRGASNFHGRGSSREVCAPFAEATDQCQACGACAIVCPTGGVDLATITARRMKQHKTGYDMFLGARPSIDLAHPQASPRVPVIDRDNCVYFKTGECGLCAKVCQAGAIDYEQQEETVELEVGAMVLTPGFEAFDATRRGEFGFGYAQNVLTNVQFERILSAAGPTAGHVRRPSDGKTPQRLAFIQCVGSRDTGCDNDYCSSVCCMAATKEAILAKTHEPELDVTIFFLDMRAFGKDFDRYCDRAKNQLGVRYVRSFISKIHEMPGTQNLRLIYAVPPAAGNAGEGIEQIEEEFDMVVLSLGLEPSASMQEQAKRLGVVLNRWGFADTRELQPLDTSRPGVFVAGAFQEPKDIPDTVMQASAAAGRVMELLAPARGTRVLKKSYPPERDISDEPPRVGIFVCHCGSNIASVVDVERVVQAAREFPYVVHAERNTYTCADDSQDLIKEKIIELRLNRVVIASCTPRTHEPIFRDTLRDAGLNPYLLEMANIRDQCSWVHPSEPQRATDKAIDLVRMIAGRTAQLQPLKEESVPVCNAALVIGGGIAGMTAALSLADQGFPVHLVEKQAQLGGTIEQLHKTLDGGDVQALLAESIERVGSHPRITTYLSSIASKVDGHVGKFTATITTGEQSTASPAAGGTEVSHGAVVVATGANEHKPQSYGYGQSDRVVTQLELSDRLGRGSIELPEKPTIVMIQCVEQRNEERPYCSRVCCTSAVNNALELKKMRPEARIVVFYRDVRTYGFREAAYREAREQGVLFVRYDEDSPPEVNVDGAIHVKATEPTLARPLELEADLLVLATPMVPQTDRQDISSLLKVPLNADGFFLEAHMKLRPVDFASEGLFLCGTAHAPKFITEAISQAKAVAARAASILSRKEMAVGGVTAWVDPNKCISCMTCVHVCPYMAPHVGPQNKAEVQGAVCMGCGSCSSECPAQAITLHHFTNDQILGAIEGLLGKRPGEEPVEAAYPEQVGVAQPRWNKS